MAGALCMVYYRAGGCRWQSTVVIYPPSQKAPRRDGG